MLYSGFSTPGDMGMEICTGIDAIDTYSQFIEVVVTFAATLQVLHNFYDFSELLGFPQFFSAKRNLNFLRYRYAKEKTA